MSAESTLIFAGTLVVLTPFLGLPSEWYGYIFLVLGMLVTGIGIMLRTRRTVLSEHRSPVSEPEQSPEKEETSNIA